MKPSSKQKKYFGLIISALLHTPGLHFWALFYILFFLHLVSLLVIFFIKLSPFRKDNLLFSNSLCDLLLEF
jgi:hypothetical protein